MSGLPPKRDIYFSIDLVFGVAPMSKNPYSMSTQKLVEMIVVLKEAKDNGYIRPSVSLWEAHILFVKKKYGTLKLSIKLKEG